MAFSHSKGSVFKIQDSGGATRDISSFTDKCDLPYNFDTAETSTFGVNSKTYVVGLGDGKVTLEGPWDPTLEGYFAGILGMAAARTWEYAPTGTTVGNRKDAGSAFVTSYDVTSDLTNAVRWSAELQITGDVTRTTY